MGRLLEIRGLTVTYGGRRGAVRAVADLDLDLEPGEILGLVGESGAGKSTVGAAILGLVDPPARVEAKSLFFAGEPLDLADEEHARQIRGKRIGAIFQDPMTSLDPLFTIGDQLVETMRAHLPLSEGQALERARVLLEQVGIAEPMTRLKQHPHQFSGGQRQRIVIAMALACEPELVIADEPTTALDVSLRAQILDLVTGLCKARGTGVLLVTHDMGVIDQVTDRVAVMYRGRLVEVGPTAEILGRPQHAYTKSLMAAVPRPNVRLHRFPRVAYGEAVETKPIRRAERVASTSAGPALALQGLSRSFVTRRGIMRLGERRFQAVDGVSLELRQGEVLGLVGESGSGKSTIAQMIAGLLRPSAGSLLVGGIDIAKARSDAELGPMRRRLQMVFQDPYASLNPRLRVADIVAEPILFHKLAANRAEALSRASDVLATVGLEGAVGRRYPHEFSGGQRQRIAIARALASRPEILVCDEPTSALDVSIQAQILNLLKDLQDAMGLSMLFISHDLPVVRQMCDRVAVLKDGKLVELADTEALFTSPTHAYTAELLRLMPKLQGLGPTPS